MRLISAASGVSMYRNATQFYQMARTYRLTSALPCIPVACDIEVAQLVVAYFDIKQNSYFDTFCMMTERRPFQKLIMCLNKSMTFFCFPRVYLTESQLIWIKSKRLSVVVVVTC